MISSYTTLFIKVIVLAQLLTALNCQNFLYRPKQYDTKFTATYNKMMGSLLNGEPSHFEQLSDLFEKTKGRVGSSANKPQAKSLSRQVPECLKSFQQGWTAVKDLQSDESNTVRLIKNVETGKMYVEKSKVKLASLQNEVNFFNALEVKDPRFPEAVCKEEERRRNQGYAITTKYINGKESHLAAASANRENLQKMAAQLFRSISKMHELGFVHCDLKPGNVMVELDFKLVIIDFGMTRRTKDVTGFRGSPYTRAPELMEFAPGRLGSEIDWWAYGITVAIWFYYYHYPQYAEVDQLPHLLNLGNGEHIPQYSFAPFKLKDSEFTTEPFPDVFSPEFRSYIALFLSADPELRNFDKPEFQKLVSEHKFFEGFDWSTVI